jgi:hypothetical protein
VVGEWPLGLAVMCGRVSDWNASTATVGGVRIACPVDAYVVHAIGTMVRAANDYVPRCSNIWVM